MCEFQLEKVLASWNLPSYKTTTPTELIEKLKSFQNELEPQQEPLRKALTPLSAAYLSASDQFDAKPNKPAYEAVFRAAELEYESAKKKFEDNVQQLEDLKKAEQVLLNLSTILSESRHYIPTLRNGGKYKNFFRDFFNSFYLFQIFGLGKIHQRIGFNIIKIL